MQREWGWEECFPLATLRGVCPGSDHAKSMQRVWNYLSTILPPEVLWLQGHCKQHASGLVLAPFIVFVDMLCSLFCIVNLLHTGSFYQHYLEGLHLVIQSSVVRFTDEDDCEPSEVDAAYSRQVLELCFYGGNLHALSISENEAQQQIADQAAKLRAGRHLLRVCQGDWRANTIFHWSRNGCCSNDAEAAVCVFGAVHSCIGCAVPVPALNKWLQVWPAAAQLGLGGCLHNLLSRAVEYAHTLAIPASAEDIDEDPSEGQPGQGNVDHDEADGAAVGLPRDERKAQQKEKAARAKKSLSWIKHRDTTPKLLVWLCISQHIMRLHFYLFRDASSMEFKSDDGRQPPIFDFADTSRSRASVALSGLMALMFPDLPGQSSSGWGVMFGRHGVDWPSGCADLARKGLMLVMGNLWRRLVWYFRRPPWRWAKIVNPAVPMEEGGSAFKHV